MKRLLALVFGVGLGLVLLSACSLDPQQTIVVTTTADGRDAVPGDGICEVTVGAGDCSLRAAVDEANAAAVFTRVLLAPSTTYPLTSVGADDTNAAGDLDLAPASGSLTIEAPAPGAIIDARGASSALDIRRGIVVDHGVGATGASAAGVLVRSSTLLGVDRASIHTNTGIGLEVEGGGAARVGNATISTNGGAGIRNDGTLDLRWDTVARNGAGGLAGAGSTTVATSIIAKQVSGADCAAPVTSTGGNLASDASCTFAQAGDVNGVNPLIGPLGGAGPAHAPANGSAAIDAIPYGTNGCTVDGADTVDQRGATRPQGLGCDRGAIEVGRAAIRVGDAADTTDAAPGNGVCADSSGRCTLRAAVQEANARAGADVIVIGDLDPRLAIAGANEDAAATGDLDITDDLLLIGRGRTVDGAGLDRVLDLRGADVTIDGLVVQGGASGAEGGGLRSDGGSTVLQSSTIRNNTAVLYGGGLAHRSGSLVIDRSWVDANVVTNQFPGIYPIGGGGLHVGVGDVTVVGSTFTANSAIVGGGILNQGAIGEHNQLTVTSSTITRNIGAGIHGGIVWPAGSTATHIASVTGSTIVGNAGPAIQEASVGGCDPHLPVCSFAVGGGVAVRGSILQGSSVYGSNLGACEILGSEYAPPGRGSLGYNVAEGGCGSPQTTDLSVAPRLGPLMPESGSPPVLRPFADSPALDLVPAGTAGLCGSAARDQLGAARPAGPGCDAGAIEGDNGVTPSPRSLVVASPADVHDAVPADGVCATAAGVCTLRAAVDEANAWPGADSISIAPGVDPELSLAASSPFANGGGALLVDEQLSIDGGGATVDANQLDRVFTLGNGMFDPVSFSDLRITGGSTASDGGAIFGQSVVLDHVDVVGNHGGSNGGGVWAIELVATDSSFRDNTTSGDGGGLVAATIDLDRSVVADNVAGGGGGGARVWLAGSIDESSFEGNQGAQGGGLAVTGNTGSTYQAVVRRSTFEANTATTGGGLYVDGSGHEVEVALSTFASNAATDGGGIAIASGTVKVGASTLAGNVGSASGGVVTASSGSVVFVASIVSSPGTDCAGAGAITSAGYNLGADASCPFSEATDVSSVDPLLGPLADNGGPTRTRLPAFTSPVVDAIPAGSSGPCPGPLGYLFDQQLQPRPSGLACNIGSVEASGSGPSGPLSLTVDTGADAVDAALGDGLCATAAGRCSLRAAIGEANTIPGHDTITIAAGIDPVLSITGRDEQFNATGDLDVRDAITIHGGGATISAGGRDRVLDVVAPTDLDRLTLLGGDTGASATPNGAVVAAAADLTMTNVTVTLGSTRGNGAGLAVSSGLTRIVASTFTLGSTEAGIGAIFAPGGDVNISGSVVDGPLPLCVGTVISLGYNVAADGSCGAGATDVVGATLIGPLRATGGFDVHLPYTGSAALDRIPSGTPGLCDGTVAVDERGIVRPAGGACDAGAAEGGAGFGVAPATTWIVTSSADAVDTNPGDGACVATSGGCTLRAAIDEANARPGPDTIAFDSARTVTLTRTGQREAGNRTGDLDAYGDLTIQGNGAVVDANTIDRVLQQRTGVLHTEQLTLRRGRVADADERGGVLLLAGGGTLDRTVISGGRLPGGGRIRGAGVASLDGPVTVTRSTITDNVIGGFDSAGGGLWVQTDDPDSQLVVSNSTITNNAAFGGAAFATSNTWSTFDAVVTSSTIAGGAGGFSLMGSNAVPSVRIAGSVVDASDLSSCGVVESDGWNVFTTTCWAFPSAGNPTDVVAPSGLGALAANGGPTPTRLPGAGSAPIDRIPVGTAGLCDATTGPDQRGVARPQGAACDAGAVEQ